MEAVAKEASQTPITDAALFNHDPKTRVASLEVVGALAEVSRKLEADRAALLDALCEAQKLVGEIPAGVLGTQEPAYKALGVIEDAIEKAAPDRMAALNEVQRRAWLDAPSVRA